MITALHLIASDNVDIRLDFLSLAERGGMSGLNREVKKYMYAKTRGIKWIADNKEYMIYQEGVKIYGIVTPDQEKLVIVYPAEHAQYSAPGNAVIHHADGSIFRLLTCPEPISELGRQRKRYMNYTGPFRLYFGGAIWKRNTNSDILLAMNIGFDLEYFETRELNYITGEFGSCLNSGMT